MNEKKKDNCPVCGAKCKIIGKTTLNYEPITLDVGRVETVVQETWRDYYSVADGYVMHETEIECCNKIAKAIVEEIEK